MGVRHRDPDPGLKCLISKLLSSETIVCLPFLLMLFVPVNESVQVEESFSSFTSENVKRRYPREVRADIEHIKAKFKAYEDCMDANRELSLKFYKNFVKAEIVMEGQAVKFSSMICPRPDQDMSLFKVRWFRLLPSSMRPVLIKIDSEKFIVTPDKMLIVTAAKVDDGGQYLCYRNQDFMAAYMLDVVQGERYESVAKPPDKGKRPARPMILRENNLKLSTSWSEWSKCSVCNKRGQHRRLGFCTVSKVNPHKPVRPRDISWLTQFEDGLPCRSSLLPEEIKSLKKIKRRKSESMVAHCFEACPTLPAVKVYTDANGEVVETVDVGAGFVSVKEGVPSLPKMVKRKIFYERVGKRIKLECPHDEIGDIAVLWQNGSQTLNALLLKRQTRARVIITAQYHLAIRKLHYSDTAAYSCWVNGEHIATIKIRVTDKMKRDYKDYILMAGFGAVILILISICCGVCCAQRKRTLR